MSVWYFSPEIEFTLDLLVAWDLVLMLMLLLLLLLLVWFLMVRYILWSNTLWTSSWAPTTIFPLNHFSSHPALPRLLFRSTALSLSDQIVAVQFDVIRYDMLCVCVCVSIYLRYITPKSIFIAKSLHMFSIRHRLEITSFKYCENKREKKRERPFDRLEITILKMIVFDGLIREREREKNITYLE